VTARWLRPTAEHVLGVVLAVLAVLPWSAAVTAPTDGIAVVGGVVGGALVGLLCARVLRTRTSTELVCNALLLVAFLLLAIVRDPFGFAAVATGLRDGLPRVLSTTLPILDVSWGAVPVAVAAWVTGSVVTSSLARARGVALPASCLLVAFVTGYAATLGGRPGDPSQVERAVAVALAAGVAGLAALRARWTVPAGQRGRGLVRVLTAGATVAAAVLVATIVVDAVPTVPDAPVEPRLVPELVRVEPTSPLLVTRQLRADRIDEVVGTVTVDTDWSGFVPFAVLDRYDGRVWSTASDRFEPTGGALPVDLVAAAPGPSARFAQVDVTATGAWLPFVGRIGTIEGVSVLHNGASSYQPVLPGDALAYRLALAQPAIALEDEDVDDDEQLARGAVGGLDVPTSRSDRRPPGERVCRLLAFSRAPNADPAIDEVDCGTLAPPTVGYVRAATTLLREGRAVPDDLVGGEQLAAGTEALADLLDLVGAPPTQDPVGTPEQFSAALALLLDDAGLPVRLVTGFRVEPAVGTEVPLTGEDAWTWVEVLVDGRGWLVVDPVPSEEDRTVDDGPQEELTAPEEEPVTAEPDRSVVAAEPETTVGRAPVEDETGWQLWAVAASPVLALLLAWVVASTRRLVRRRRRADGSPRARVVGAWHEVLDEVHLEREVDVVTLAGGEVASEITERLPARADDVLALATLANRAVFSSRPMQDDEADAAWATAASLRRDLRRRRGPRRRFLGAWSVAPRAVTANATAATGLSASDGSARGVSLRRREPAAR
jgi:hypothetical protein